MAAAAVAASDGKRPMKNEFYVFQIFFRPRHRSAAHFVTTCKHGGETLKFNSIVT